MGPGHSSAPAVSPHSVCDLEHSTKCSSHVLYVGKNKGLTAEPSCKGAGGRGRTDKELLRMLDVNAAELKR